MTPKGVANTNFLLKNIAADIWVLVLGEVLAYIASQLESVTPDCTLVGWRSVIMGLAAISCMDKTTADANPSKNED